MEIIEKFNLHYISFISVITFTYNFLAFFFLALIRKKSQAARHLQSAFGFISLLSLAYVIGYSLDHPFAAYHRWFAVGSVLAGMLYLGQFFFYFPAETNGLTARRLFLAQWSAAAITTLSFIIDSLFHEKIFKPEGELWDVLNPTMGSITSVIIMIFILITIGAGCWRTVKTSGRERMAVLGMTMSVLMLLLPSGIGNMLARTGILTLSLYQLLFALSTIIGMFMILLFFVNVTRDRTTFLVKIISACVVTILMIIGYISYIAYDNFEIAYDESHRKKILQMLLDAEQRPDDLEYLITSGPGDVPSRYLFDRTGRPLDQGMYRLQPLPPAGKRFIRQDAPAARTHYMSFIHYDSKTGKKYEAGFSYQSYRQLMHIETMRMLIVLGIILAVMLIGFRFFFLRTLLVPLHSLIRGVTEISRGNTSIEIPVRTDDEIGFLTNNFNNMAATIKEARVKIDEYTNHLEDKVKERTIELEESNSSLQEAMEALLGVVDDLKSEIKDKVISYFTKNKLEEVAAYIDNNFTDEITRESLAEQMNLNPDYLGKMFKKYKEKNISDYINEQRIKKACELLLAGDESIIDIAFSVGFQSLPTFNRVFKRIMKESPSSFRNKRQNSQ